jgi:hypothetical protein
MANPTCPAAVNARTAVSVSSKTAADAILLSCSMALGHARCKGQSEGPSGGELVGHLMVMVQGPMPWTSKT